MAEPMTLSPDSLRNARALADDIVKHWPAPPWTPLLDDDGEWVGDWRTEKDGEPRDLDGGIYSDYANEFAPAVAALPVLARAVPALIDEVERLQADVAKLGNLLSEQAYARGVAEGQLEGTRIDRDSWRARAIAHGCDAEKGDADCG